MRVVVLTSSRADYGIYLPLLKKLQVDDFFQLKIIAFGTHLSTFFGYTLDQIKQDNFEVHRTVESLILGDSPEAIATGMAVTISKFSAVWQQEKDETDLILCLGDRFEMFAAVTASIPFNIPIGHFHGGETTLGAIDNIFRHSITLMSKYHFTATKIFAKKITQITGSKKDIFHVGSLSLDNLLDLKLLTKKEFKKRFQIDISQPTILVTFHPETVSLEKNEIFAKAIRKALEIAATNFQIIITMPNADTNGKMIRQEFSDFSEKNNNVITVENFGTLGYFSCMQHCSFLLGNTSSGIIEAASFGKYVINLGDRQKGRVQGKNIVDCKITVRSISKKIKKVGQMRNFIGENPYQRKNKSAAKSVIEILKIINVTN